MRGKSRQPEATGRDTLPVPTVPTPRASCENCGTPLYGKYCYACGQPTTGMVRHFSSIMSDVADSVLNIDERLFRTVGPLYFRPGKLTLDYFAGKRARYVTPFRLVFFLAIIAFFSIQLTVRGGFDHVIQFDNAPVAGNATGNVSEAASKDTHFDKGNISFNNTALWNHQTRPLRVDWLPGFANAWLNDAIEHARINLHALSSGTSQERKAAGAGLLLGLFSVAPTVLFVLLPVFALLLKIFYIFKRRLYMEHLIVTMHSQAFLMLLMLVLLTLGLLRGWLVPHAEWLGVPVWLLQAAAWLWIFVYLCLMQKRVYRQAWIMTTVKYWCIGFCYTILIGFGLIFAVLLSLTGA